MSSPLIVVNLGVIMKPEDFEQYIERRLDGVYICNICHESSSDRRYRVLNHVESKHFPNTFSYQCQHCNTVLGTNTALIRHIDRVHKTKWINLWQRLIVVSLGMITNPEDYDQYITKVDGILSCGLCHAQAGRRRDIRNHIESKHFPNSFSYQCQYCNTVVGTNKALSRHIERAHKQNWNITNWIKFSKVIDLSNLRWDQQPWGFWSVCPSQNWWHVPL